MTLTWADELIRQYLRTISDLKDQSTLLSDNELDIEDRKKINSMIRDLQDSVQWMETGREPGARRGIDQRSVYQSTALMDTDIFPSLAVDEEQPLTTYERRRVAIVLRLLSKQERICYALFKAYELPQQQIAEEMNLSRQSVRTYIDRAEKKIKKYFEEKKPTMTGD
ncbi:sigma factor-like helix-turn-helix DNA-binding protein [Geomicrobium sediminis]|uniref:RNA polymerase sigma-70 factor (ECF subfamily) n=1 Tax=Geomicrobium sediminis TaxID=1347788 RepID=A0ABS2P6U1_9BACL|nr:sigma factor-like helix-turn-helix DNA-binding protein [Geomicrobium sediminis]MBM7631113.1 RNA polymerase sigma-70 factor (ECF subfamily) [Geomicrobium sediminis]